VTADQQPPAGGDQPVCKTCGEQCRRPPQPRPVDPAVLARRETARRKAARQERRPYRPVKRGRRGRELGPPPSLLDQPWVPVAVMAVGLLGVLGVLPGWVVVAIVAAPGLLFLLVLRRLFGR
jgi:hypothetical protein